MHTIKSERTNSLILVLHLGSSSLKFSLIDFNSFETEYEGSITGIGNKKGVMQISKNGKLHQ